MTCDALMMIVWQSLRKSEGVRKPRGLCYTWPVSICFAVVLVVVVAALQERQRIWESLLMSRLKRLDLMTSFASPLPSANCACHACDISQQAGVV